MASSLYEQLYGIYCTNRLTGGGQKDQLTEKRTNRPFCRDAKIHLKLNKIEEQLIDYLRRHQEYHLHHHQHQDDLGCHHYHHHHPDDQGLHHHHHHHLNDSKS